MSPEWYQSLPYIFLDTSFRAPVFAAIVGLILKAARVRSGSVRHAAWTVVLFSMVFLPVLPHFIPSFSIPIPVPLAATQAETRTREAMPPANAVNHQATVAPVPEGPHHSSAVPESERELVWPFAAAAVYFIGVLVLLSRLLFGWRALSGFAHACKPIPLHTVATPELRTIPVSVCESDRAVTPVTTGVLCPRIILPTSWRLWAPEKLSAVLAHELSHVRRRDMLIAFLSHLNRCIFWFHPLAWWLEQKLATTAELACDDNAVRATGKTRIYAEVLLDMARAVQQRGGRLAWQGLGVHGNGFLSQRIDRLLRGEPFCETTRIRKAVVALGCAAAILLVAACREPSISSAPQNYSKAAARSMQRTPSQSIFAKRIRIITHPVNAPFEFGDGTGVQGLDVDIGNEVAKNLGFAVKWVKAPDPGYSQNRLERVVRTFLGRSPGDVCMSYSEHMFELIKSGKAEILISAIPIDPQKTKDFEFSRTYYDTGDIIAHSRGRLDITDLASLSGKKVGVAAGRPGDSFMAGQAIATDVDITRFFSLDDALGALNRKEIDAVVGDEPFITYSCIKSFHNTTTVPFLINKYKYAAVVRKGRRDLLTCINQTLDRLDSTGALKRFDETWLGEVRKYRDLEVASLNTLHP
jgi:ABC-type amino acid transport substrate-binding protein